MSTSICDAFQSCNIACIVARNVACNVATLQYYNIATSQLCKVATLQYYSIATLQYYSIATLQYCSITTLQHCNILTLRHCKVNITSKMKTTSKTQRLQIMQTTSEYTNSKMKMIPKREATLKHISRAYSTVDVLVFKQGSLDFQGFPNSYQSFCYALKKYCPTINGFKELNKLDFLTHHAHFIFLP